ncbi:uncharacterized protein Z518_07190 [Rhinocladiella mackenziei CBS 650.93]|uniref:ABC transporter n=1 Tax=Rhinocladiella mackenziei CBS 650.93 TaxID=1442369 RepID=A0A0D2FNK1_9EURO|nr:uncharacterized protein Z518_07190 [Rhinocladiella mackenziei CBS 650.93]KIX03637.1 hypothetical protein Z518_07190 [Rhinocladiella mackenziei CBS 650.93]
MEKLISGPREPKGHDAGNGDLKIEVPETLEKKSEKSQSKAWRAYFRLFAYASTLDIILRVCGAATALASGTALPLMTIIFGDLVQDFNNWALGTVEPSEFRHAINRNTQWLLYLFVGKFLAYCAHLFHCVSASRMGRRIRLRYLDVILHRPISYFDDHNPGSVATSLSTDTNLIEVGLAEKVTTLFQAASMIISAFTIAFTKSWKLTLVTATTIPYMMLTTGLLAALDAKMEAKARAIYSNASNVAEEAFRSVIMIATLGAEDRVVQRFKQIIEKAKTLGFWKGPLEASIYGNMFFTVQSGYALALYYGAQLLSRGQVKDGGTVISVLFSVVIGSSSMGMVAPSLPSFIKATASAQQVLKVLDDDTPSGSEAGQNLHIKPATVTGQLKLANISFAYPTRPSVNVLHDVSIDIDANQITAVVGHSGCGKSTMIGLLERWYDPIRGSICLDGTDIRDLDLNWWRGQIGLVLQEPVLFNDTIYENVLNGLHDGRRERLGQEELRKLVVEACITADAHNFVLELPERYETMVGANSDLLSGGQKQRIAIARSIISDPKILLFDEATSALDSESEQTVQAAIAKVSRGRTTLMIAHKLSTIAGADKIVVMENGHVMEQGSHSSLLSLGGIYTRLLRAQNLIRNERRSHKGPVELKTRPMPERRQSPTTQTPLPGSPGLALTAEAPTILESKSISRRFSLIRCIISILSEQRRIIPIFTGGLLGSVFAGAAMPILAFLFSKLVTVFQYQGHDLISRANFWALMFFVLALSNLVAYATVWGLFSVVGTISSSKYRAEYFRGLLIQDASFFEDGNSSGSLAALLALDGDELETMVSMNVGLLALFIVDLVACSLLALAVYWKLALVGVMCCVPTLLVAGYVRLRMDKEAQDRAAKSFLESARLGAEAVGAIRTVASLTLESRITKRYAGKLQAAMARSLRRTVFSMALLALSDTLDLFAMILVFWYGGRLVSYGEVGVSAYFIVYTAIIFGGQSAGYTIGYTTSKLDVLDTVQDLGLKSRLRGITKSQAAMNRILYMKNKKPSINSSAGTDPRQQPPAETALEFKHVSFRYPARPDIEVLHELDLQVRRGERVCITGPSGCGKSTIIALIERFYDITSGELSINGADISSIDIRAYRLMLGFVSQETYLFQGTIRDNLLLGVDGPVTDEELNTACGDAKIYDFIVSLPDGYDTECGPRGQAFSGGQRQRIAIARALLRNPEILLLDEATSALDPENEVLVREALNKAVTDRTIISITHQVETMKMAESVFVMDRGKVVEAGTFEELMERKGFLWEMMLQGELM